MLNTFSRLLIIWEPAIETWAQKMNGGPGNELGGPESWTVPPPCKLYFNPCQHRPHTALHCTISAQHTVHIDHTLLIVQITSLSFYIYMIRRDNLITSLCKCACEFVISYCHKMFTSLASERRLVYDGETEWSFVYLTQILINHHSLLRVWCDHTVRTCRCASTNSWSTECLSATSWNLELCQNVARLRSSRLWSRTPS